MLTRDRRRQDRHVVDHRRPRRASTPPPSPSSAPRWPTCAPTGHQVVVVTSGAHRRRPARPRPRRGDRRPRDAVTLQAVSAVGQSRLMRVYDDALGRPRPGRPARCCSPRSTSWIRQQYLHARGTLQRLLELGVVPVVNENDAIADDEIRFGDNDRLAALVAHLVGADLLVLLTDTPGLLTADPRLDPTASLIEEIVEVDHELEALAGGAGSGRGSGGMASKVAAAKIAAWSGVRAVIAAADRDRRAGRRGGRRRRASARSCSPATGACRPASSGSPSPSARRARSSSTTAPGGPCCERRRVAARRPASSAVDGRASTPTTRSRSPAPTARCSPRAWSGSTPPASRPRPADAAGELAGRHPPRGRPPRRPRRPAVARNCVSSVSADPGAG